MRFNFLSLHLLFSLHAINIKMLVKNKALHFLILLNAKEYKLRKFILHTKNE